MVADVVTGVLAFVGAAAGSVLDAAATHEAQGSDLRAPLPADGLEEGSFVEENRARDEGGER